MDKKKTLSLHKLFAVCALLASALSVTAQEVEEVQFCGKNYNYAVGHDSITLYLKFLDADGNHIKRLEEDVLENSLVVREGRNNIPLEKCVMERMTGGTRIPDDYTFSVLIDLSFSKSEMEEVYEAVKNLVHSASDSSVFISFFGDRVSASKMVTKKNYKSFRDSFFERQEHKFFYDALYAKLIEFSPDEQKVAGLNVASGYENNGDIRKRAEDNPDKNILFVFIEGSKMVDEDQISFRDVTDYQSDIKNLVPRVYAFYNVSTENLDENVDLLLDGVSRPRKNGEFGSREVIEDREGNYLRSANQEDILKKFGEVVDEAKYDYSFTYKVPADAHYSGRVTYTALWDDKKVGTAEFSIGTEENPWPVRDNSTPNVLMNYVLAILITLLTIAFFFCIMKILIPFIKSKSFEAKFYNYYRPEAGIQKRICYYCKQPILPGQKVVTKCMHIMHVHCWKQNDYQCAEYGQNCKTGIQEHVDWHTLFTKASFRDCLQAIAGVCAGFVSWVVYELLGRGILTSFATAIAQLFIEKEQLPVLGEVVSKLSSFFAIGLLLAFFLSLVFRFNDEYRNKNFAIFMKILGLSLLTALIGLLAFVVGGVILCMILSSIGGTVIPWYCSLPAYLLFSVCTALSLTIKSSIPVKSAMIGGLCSAFIGFLVLYFSKFAGGYRVLLDFIIYGGGLGASLVTVRLLAEKYFLVIMNGVKQGTRIPIHKWMNATGGGNKVSIGMTGDCEIQMNWDKSNRVAKEHAVLYIDQARTVPVIKPMATGVVYNSRAELPVSKPSVLTNSDTFKIGDTIFQYVETD